VQHFDIYAADETEPRALNWFDVSSSYGWYVKLPAFCVSHLQQIHDTLSFCRLFNFMKNRKMRIAVYNLQCTVCYCM
jgi:hypothetical protein